MSDSILHCNFVRLRATGAGSLHLKLIALYEDYAVDLPPEVSLTDVTLQASTSKLTQNHANFESQYIQLELSLDTIDHHFLINKITLFVKPVGQAYPM